MKGYWHMVAISTLVAILTVSFTNPMFIIVYLVWLYWLYWKRRAKNIPLVISLMALPLILFYISHDTNNEPQQLDNLEIEKINGKVISPVTNNINKIEFIVQEKNKQNTLVTYFKNTSNSDNTIPTVKNGASCSIKGIKQLPPASRNPGQFDYRSYLQKQGISNQITLNNSKDVACTGESIISKLYAIRNKLISKVDDSFTPFTSSWIRALLLGDDSSINQSTTALFQRWNLSHLLAISGLHVGLIVAIMYIFLVKFGLVTKEKAQGLMIVLLPIYPLLAGGAPSVWRSCLMTLLVLLLLKLKVKLSSTDVLSIIFVLFILFDKEIIHQLGFQFSFLVTFGILLSKRLLSITTAKVFVILTISFLSQMLLLPLQIFHFYFFNPLSVFVNLFVVPYFTLFVIPAAFILIIISYFSPFLLSLGDLLFESIHKTLLNSLQWIDQWLFDPWVLGEFPLYLFPVYFVIFILFMGRLVEQQYKRAFLYGCVLTLSLVSISLQPYVNPTGTVTMLDVGQGDSFIVELPYRKGIIIIDAAGSMSRDFETPSDKVYSQVIKPYLYSRGIKEIDMLFISHNDSDHAGSVPYLVDGFKVKEIVISEYLEFSEGSLAKLQEEKTEVTKVRSGDVVEVEDQKFFILHPNHDYGSTNDNSLVLFTKIGGLRWLFTGDISKHMEGKIVETYPNLNIDVLKVPHHGSNTSTSDQLLQKTTPQLALLSVGVNNRYGHPTQEIINRLNRDDITIFRTDYSGAVQYKFFKDNGTFFNYLP